MVVWTIDGGPAAAAVSVDDDGPDVVDEAGRVLCDLDAVLAPWFARRCTRLRAQEYVRGLGSLVERKNSWQLAEHAGHATPDRFQRLLASAAWDEAGVREDVRDWAVGFLADAEAVLVPDETGFLKKGTRPVFRGSIRVRPGGSRTARSGCSWPTPPRWGGC
jgi:hypothetical protein